MLLSAAFWTGDAGDNQWTTAANWSTGRLPGPADDVTIDVTGIPALQLTSGTQSIHSLIANDPLIVSGGTLAVATTARFAADLTLTGGTLKGGDYTAADGAALSVQGPNVSVTLDGVTLDADLTIYGATVNVVDGLTVNRTLDVSTTSDTSIGATLAFQGTQTLGGAGQVTFTGEAADSFLLVESPTSASPATLTVGSGITISAGIALQTVHIRGANGNEALVNQGTINADAASAPVVIENFASVSNSGTLEATDDMLPGAGGGSLSVQGLTGNANAILVRGASSVLNLYGNYVTNAVLHVPAGTALGLNGNWSNTGALNVDGGDLYLGGTFATAGIGTVGYHSGNVFLSGTLINIGSTLALSPTTGSWNLLGGGIVGGTVTATGGAGLFASQNAPDGPVPALDLVTLGANLTVMSTLDVLHGLALNGAIITLAPSGTFSPRADVVFLGTQALGGSGQVVFANASTVSVGASDSLEVEGNGSQTGAATLTIGPGISIHVAPGAKLPGSVAGHFVAFDSIVNQGTIDADQPGQMITVTGATVANAGIMRATAGKLSVSGLTGNTGFGFSLGGAGSALSLDGPGYAINAGLNAPPGTTLTLGGTWTNASGSTISATGATLTLGGTSNPWSNGGTIVANNATVNLAGVFNTSSLIAFNRTAGAVNVTGTLNNLGDVLDLTPTTGSYNLKGGTIIGGHVSESGGAVLAISNGAAGGTLDGVTLDSDLTLAGPLLNVKDGLTLSVGARILLTGSKVTFLGTQMVGGNGQIVFAPTNPPADAVGTLEVQGDGTMAGAATLTIGPGVTIHGAPGATGQAMLQGANPLDTLVNQGRIDADQGGLVLNLISRGARILNSGTITASTAGAITNVICTSFANNGSAQGTGGGTVHINAASASLNPATGTLSVLGTDGSDVLVLTQAGMLITVIANGATSTFDAGAVGQISVIGLAGDDTLVLSGPFTAPATLDGRAGGNDTIKAEGGDDSLIGGTGHNLLIAGSGNDTLDGSLGAGDTLQGGSGTDVLVGGHGPDRLYGGSGPNSVLLGNGGDDTLIGGIGDGTTLSGGGGPADHDLIIGGRGREMLLGGDGNDTLQGGHGNQTLDGGAGNDQITGGFGNQLLEGQAGDDTIYGGTGRQTLNGGDGNDYIVAGRGNQLLFGGTGADMLFGGQGNDTMYGGANTDPVSGGDSSNDTLVAGSGNNLMYGQGGDDLLIGGPGNNYMNGGAGNDTFVNRGGGADTIDGGPGFDAFESDPNDVILNCELNYDPAPALKPASPALTSSAGTRARLRRAHRDTRLTPATATNPYQVALAIPVGTRPSAQVANGLLEVIGTVGNDAINLRQNAGVINVSWNNVPIGNFAVASISTGVFVNSGRGNDVVTLENTQGGPLQAVTEFAYIVVGPGNDGIIGGAGDNYFDMGAAPFQTLGRPSNVHIFGFGTNNAIDFSKRSGGARISLDGVASGQLGLENVSINVPGAAVVYGTQGNDAIFGNGANDQLFGAGGNDTLIGGTGPTNAFSGGPGTNKVVGGPGVNTIAVQNGQTDFFSRGGNHFTRVVGDINLDREINVGLFQGS